MCTLPLSFRRAAALSILITIGVDPSLSIGIHADHSFPIGVGVLGNHTLNAAEPNEGGEALYEPKDDDFKAAYEADTANAAKQKREEYYGWAKAFYKGNLIISGWTSQAKRLIAKIGEKKTRDEITVMLNGLGRKIAQEWSKDSSVSQIGANELTAYSRQFEQALKKDDGSGSKIREAIIAVDKVVTTKLDKTADGKKPRAEDK